MPPLPVFINALYSTFVLFESRLYRVGDLPLNYEGFRSKNRLYVRGDRFLGAIASTDAPIAMGILVGLPHVSIYLVDKKKRPVVLRKHGFFESEGKTYYAYSRASGKSVYGNILESESLVDEDSFREAREILDEYYKMFVSTTLELRGLLESPEFVHTLAKSDMYREIKDELKEKITKLTKLVEIEKGKRIELIAVGMKHALIKEKKKGEKEVSIYYYGPRGRRVQTNLDPSILQKKIVRLLPRKRSIVAIYAPKAGDVGIFDVLEPEDLSEYIKSNGIRIRKPSQVRALDYTEDSFFVVIRTYEGFVYYRKRKDEDQLEVLERPVPISMPHDGKIFAFIGRRILEIENLEELKELSKNFFGRFEPYYRPVKVKTLEGEEAYVIASPWNRIRIKVGNQSSVAEFAEVTAVSQPVKARIENKDAVAFFSSARAGLMLITKEPQRVNELLAEFTKKFL